MLPIIRRITSALAASAFGPIVNVGAQILLTPLFFLHWGAEKYGEWLLLSGIPTYLAIADAGIGSAAGNEMTIRAGTGDIGGAQRTFRGSMMVSAGAAAIAIVIGLGLAGFVVGTDFFHLKVLGGFYGGEIVVILSAYVGLNFVSGVVFSAYRCCGRNAAGIVYANSSRLFEALILGVMLIAAASPLDAAVAMLVIRIFSLLIQSLGLRKTCPWLFKPYSAPDITIIRRLIKPAIAFLAFPLSNAVLLQGTLLIIGAATIDGSEIAIFSAFRTLARLPIQLTNILNASVWPEISLAFAGGNIRLLRLLHSTTVAAATYGALAASAILWLFGRAIITLWLHGRVQYDGILLMGLLLATVISAIWNASSIVLYATNRHARYGYFLLLVSAITVFLCYPAAAHFSLYGVSVVLLLSEVAMMLFVFNQSLAICQDSVRGLFSAVLHAPAMARETIGNFLSARKNP
jgi:O-antigen/teichoic acid export membrane protein